MWGPRPQLSGRVEGSPPRGSSPPGTWPGCTWPWGSAWPAARCLDAFPRPLLYVTILTFLRSTHMLVPWCLVPSSLEGWLSRHAAPSDPAGLAVSLCAAVRLTWSLSLGATFAASLLSVKDFTVPFYSRLSPVSRLLFSAFCGSPGNYTTRPSARHHEHVGQPRGIQPSPLCSRWRICFHTSAPPVAGTVHSQEVPHLLLRTWARNVCASLGVTSSSASRRPSQGPRPCLRDVFAGRGGSGRRPFPPWSCEDAAAPAETHGLSPTVLPPGLRSRVRAAPGLRAGTSRKCACPRPPAGPGSRRTTPGGGGRRGRGRGHEDACGKERAPTGPLSGFPQRDAPAYFRPLCSFLSLC